MVAFRETDPSTHPHPGVLEPQPESEQELVRSLLTGVTTRQQAEDYVREKRSDYWQRFKGDDRGFINARLRMDIADEAFALHSFGDVSPDLRLRADYIAGLLIDARERVVSTRFGHYGRVQDRWADEVVQRLNAGRNQGPLALFPVRITQAT